MKKKVRWLVLGVVAGSAWAGLSKYMKAEKAAGWKRRLERAARRKDGMKALITGASSGIGEAYARALAEQGYHLVLVARREARMQRQAAEYIRQYGVSVEVLPADLSTEEGIGRVERRIADGRDIDLLINSAGYDVFGPFADAPIEKILGLINCLELSAVRLTRAALPGMISHRWGGVVNVSSIGAFLPKPRDATYVAAKGYLNQFSESLSIELEGTGVRVQALCPGLTLSEFHEAPEYAVYRFKERIPRWMWMTPEQVVWASLAALAEDRRVCLPGWKNRLIALTAHLGLIRPALNLLRSFFPPELQYHAVQKTDPLDLLACPHCHGRLERNGTSESGEYCCPACCRTYPIVDGIPRFIQYSELPEQDRRFARFYDWFSYVYLPFSQIGSLLFGGEGRSRRTLLERLEPRGGRVLEVSIGPGVNLPYLLEREDVGEVHGLDISLGQLKRCQSFMRRRGFPAELYLGNAEELPFQDESFESIFHIGGINFFSDKKKAIEEMIRVAKPGSKILIADETERGARGYEISFPGFARLFEQPREAVRPPIDRIPQEMLDVKLDESIWGGWFYSIEFRKPGPVDGNGVQGEPFIEKGRI